MNAATVEPKIRIEVQITRADGTVEPVQIIENYPTPAGPLARLKSLLKGKE